MEDRDREKFYGASEPPDDDDDLELELEPPDTESDERRKRAATASIAARIDIDEVYREADRDRGGEIMENWLRNFRVGFRFRIKHLLIATALLAIGLTLAKFELFWTALIVLVMLSVFTLYAYIQNEERKHQAEAARKRDELYARRRAQQMAQMSGHAVGSPPPEPTTTPAEEDEDEDEDTPDTEEKPAFRFQFSVRELLMAMTVAAVVLAMIRLFGGPAVTASVLGFIALVGLIVFAVGYDPPQMVVLGWWLILVLYVAVSIFATALGGFG